METVLIAATSREDLLALVAIIALAVGGTMLAARLRVPSIVVLLALGLLAGPVSGLLDPDDLLGDLLFPFVSLSVGVILFEGGLALKFEELGGDNGPVVRRLLSVAALITWVGSSVGAAVLLGLETNLAILLGAILVVSGPTVIMPLLRLVKPRGDAAAALKWEGVFIDPIGAILAVLVFEAVLTEQRSPGLLNTVGELGYSLLAGCLVGAIAATLLIAGLRSYQITESMQPAATLMIVLAAVAVSDVWREESGLIAATLMGVILANQRRVPVQRIAEFKETLGLFLTSVLFIVLAARLSLDELEAALGPLELVFLVWLVVLVRPLAVAVATAGSRLELRERVFLAALAPRGVVAAAVASLFGLQLAEQGVAGAELLAPLTFIVILGTALVSGLTALPLARRLGLANENPQETLVVGAGEVALELARGIQRLGSDVTLAPGEHQRHDGLNVYGGHLLDDLAAIELELDRFGFVVIAGPSDEYNSVVASALSAELGRKRVFQIAVEGGEGPDAPDRRGRPLFASEITYQQLDRRIGDSDGGIEHHETDEGKALILPGESEEEDAVLARWVETQGLTITAKDDHDSRQFEETRGERTGAALRSAVTTVIESLTSFGRRDGRD